MVWKVDVTTSLLVVELTHLAELELSLLLLLLLLFLLLHVVVHLLSPRLV